MVEVVERRLRNVSNSPKLGQMVDQYFRICAGVESVSNQGAAFEVPGRLFAGAQFSRCLIFNACPRSGGLVIDFQDQCGVIKIPFILISWRLNTHLTLAATENVKF